MIVVDKNDPRYRSMTHNKWKQTLPAICEEDSLHCEDLFIEFANGNKTEEQSLKEINDFLNTKGLIK